MYIESLSKDQSFQSWQVIDCDTKRDTMGRNSDIQKTLLVFKVSYIAWFSHDFRISHGSSPDSEQLPVQNCNCSWSMETCFLPLSKAMNWSWISPGTDCRNHDLLCQLDGAVGGQWPTTSLRWAAQCLSNSLWARRLLLCEKDTCEKKRQRRTVPVLYQDKLPARSAGTSNMMRTIYFQGRCYDI